MKRRIVTALTVVFVFAAVAQAESPEEVYSFAEHLYNDAMFEAAAQQYLKFARENPTDRRAPAALVKAAECLTRTGEPERAVTVLEAVADTYPNDADLCDVKIRLGRLYLKVTRFQAADRAFSDVVLTMPDCPRVADAMLGKGEALMALNNYDGAAEVFSSLVQNFLESPAAPRASFHLAHCQRKLGRDAQALNTYQRVVTDFPGDPLAGFASLEAARMFAERGDSAAAIDFYRNAKRYEAKVFFVPGSEEGAAILESSGRHAEALRWYEELLMRTDLDDPRVVYIKAAEAAYHAGEFETVRRLTEEYGAKYPKTFSPQITYVKARAGLERKQFDQVLEDTRKLEALAPGTEWSHQAARIRGDAFLEMGRARAAIDEWRRFVSLSQDSLSRVRTLGRMAEVQFDVVRDTTAALVTLVEQLDVERRNIPSEMLRVAGVFEAAGRYNGAHEIYDDLVVRFPLSGEAEDADRRTAFLNEFTVTDYAAAASEMDAVAYEIARMSEWDGLLRVIEARIGVLKNYQSAYDLTRRVKKSSEKTAHYPRVLYLEGLARAKQAQMAHFTGRDKTANERMKDAFKPWEELTKDHAATEWAAEAASMKIVVRSQVEGVVDTSAVKRVLARYPERADRVGLTTLMGDHYYERGDAPAEALRYYQRAIASDSNDLRLRYKAGLALAQNKQNEEAFETFEAISKADGGRVGVLASYEAGRALRRLGRFEEAVRHFDRVAERDPRGATGNTAMLQAADCRYLQKQYQRALERYQSAEKLANTPQRKWEISYRIALCLERLDRNYEALARLEKCIVEPGGGSQRPRAYQNAAKLAADMGDPARQAAILETYVTEFENDAEAAAAARELVRLFLQIGETEKATVVAEWIDDKADKKDAEAKALLAMTQYRAGRSGDAEKNRRRVEEIAGADSPLLDEIKVEAAKYQYDQKAFAEAATTLSSFAKSCDGPGACEEGRYYYVVSLMGAERTDESVAASQKFFKDYPVSAWGPRLHLKLGNVLVRAGRVSESLLHYQEAAETTVDSVTAFMALKNLGVAYQDIKRWREAERVWTQMLNRFPESSFAPETALNIARCKMEYGQYEGAIHAYEQALPLLDSDAKARAFYWMGTSYERMGDYQSAVVQFLKVPYLASGAGLWVVTAELKAAECYAKINRDDAAREIYNRVIDKYGAGSNWGKLARKGIDALDASVNEQSRNTDGSNQ
jgi:tetratricopeptide (TPR) repeat protein